MSIQDHSPSRPDESFRPPTTISPMQQEKEQAILIARTILRALPKDSDGIAADMTILARQFLRALSISP
jgi:hypothetical protein